MQHRVIGRFHQTGKRGPDPVRTQRLIGAENHLRILACFKEVHLSGFIKSGVNFIARQDLARIAEEPVEFDFSPCLHPFRLTGRRNRRLNSGGMHFPGILSILGLGLARHVSVDDDSFCFVGLRFKVRTAARAANPARLRFEEHTTAQGRPILVSLKHGRPGLQPGVRRGLNMHVAVEFQQTRVHFIVQPICLPRYGPRLLNECSLR